MVDFIMDTTFIMIVIIIGAGHHHIADVTTGGGMGVEATLEGQEQYAINVPPILVCRNRLTNFVKKIFIHHLLVQTTVVMEI